METTIPDLIHNLLRMLRIPTPGPRSNAQRCSPPHALLQLLCNSPLPSGEKLPPPTTLSRERACTNFRASSVSQVVHRIHLKSQMVVSVHHLVRKRVFHMSAVAHLIRADQNAVVRIKATALLVVAFFADYAGGCDGGAAVCGPEKVDVVGEEAHDGAVGEEPSCVGLGARDVSVFVHDVFGAEVGGALGRCGAA